MSVRKEIKDLLDDRQDEYGDAGANFTTIGIMWGALLDIPPIPAFRVALMLDQMKTVRCNVNPNHMDSWDDKIGYTSHGQGIVNESRG